MAATLLCKALSSADGLRPLEMAGKYRVIHRVAGHLVGLPLLGEVVSLAPLKRLRLRVEKTRTLPKPRAWRKCSKFFREKSGKLERSRGKNNNEEIIERKGRKERRKGE